MRKRLFDRFKILISVFLSVILLTACDRTVVVTGGFAEGEVFRINTLSCSRSEMNIYLTNMANAYEATFGEQIWSTSAGNTTIEDAFKETVLAKVTRIKVLNLMAKEEKITLSGDEKKSLKKAAKAYMKTLSKNEKTELGADEDLVYQMYSEYALAEKVYNSIVDEVNFEISDDDARSITVEQIFIKTYHEDTHGRLTDYSDAAKAEAKERALAIREKAVTESDFESLCALYNEEDESTHTYRRGEMPETYENVAFALEEGEISYVITTDDGYYIVKCISTYERKATNENKEAIINEAKRKAFEEKYNEFLPNVIANINEKEWENIKIIHNADMKTDSFFDIYTDIMIDGK
ncbi:MAG: peptidyl-prolyl cis-trans isomerase [Lachnospiraceae bacterium]|nr:peptidyl-prolyl cis-trans isomerase [Lachnospiraceae bacterium]